MTLQIAKLHDDVKEQFIKQGDNIEFRPLFGRKKSMRLTRTRYELSLSSIHCVHQDGIIIKIPAVGGENARFKMTLVEDIDYSYYELESLSGEPFKVNGNFSYKSIIQINDEVIIGYNKILFKRQESRNNYLANPLKIEKGLIESDLYTLLEGETGTGKTYLAKKIHDDSQRRGEFIHINISALNENLVESELFGHTKGAFTGAIREKEGVIKRASEGTLFIDEIDSLSKEMQVKLLLFLDDKKIRPVGGAREEFVNARLIFASGRPLKNLVESGEMRSDFYYRISNGHCITIPSLRECPKSLEYHIKEFELKNEVTLSRKLVSFYKTLSWPGNIRQLFGHLERKTYLTKSHYLCLDDNDFKLLTNDIRNYTDEKIVSLNKVKNDYIKRAYFMCHEDIGLTARALNISYNTVKKSIERLSV